MKIKLSILLYVFILNFSSQSHHTSIYPVHYQTNIIWNGEQTYFGLGVDLSNRNLQIVYLPGVNLMGSNLTNSTFQGGNFSHSRIDSANLKNSELSSANFNNVYFHNSEFDNADLSNALFNNANFWFADLDYADLSESSFTNANFTGASLFAADLTGADLRYANLTDADLRYADLNNINLAGATLKNTRFTRYSELEELNNANDQIEFLIAKTNSLINQMGALLSTNDALDMISDLRIGSQMISVTGNVATIRMQLDESINLNDAWSNTSHVLEVDIPADADTKFFRFRMD